MNNIVSSVNARSEQFFSGKTSWNRELAIILVAQSLVEGNEDEGYTLDEQEILEAVAHIEQKLQSYQGMMEYIDPLA